MLEALAKLEEKVAFVESLSVPIHSLTDKCFARCPLYPNPPGQQIRNYTLADLTNLYKKYIRKYTNHILLQLAYRLISLPVVAVFYVLLTVHPCIIS
jgi:hypothetical protein